MDTNQSITYSKYPGLIPNPIISVAQEKEKSNISFHAEQQEILKVTEDGFYVRGKKVPVDEQEGLAVYKALKEFLVYHGLTKY